MSNISKSGPDLVPEQKVLLLAEKRIRNIDLKTITEKDAAFFTALARRLDRAGNSAAKKLKGFHASREIKATVASIAALGATMSAAAAGQASASEAKSAVIDAAVNLFNNHVLFQNAATSLGAHFYASGGDKPRDIGHALSLLGIS